jgi:hypothetical protein
VGFIVDAQGPPGLFGVFEDDGETGYLYLYRPDSPIEHALFIYNRGDLGIDESDVDVVWSRDLAYVGVRILDEMRGIIEVASGRDVRAPFTKRDAPGIVDHEWLRAFN